MELISISEAGVGGGVVADSSHDSILAAASSSASIGASSVVVGGLRRRDSGRVGLVLRHGGGHWGGDRHGLDSRSISELVDSDVVDLHVGVLPSSGHTGVQSVGVLSEETASHSDIDDEEKLSVERLSVGRVRVGSLSSIKVLVEVSGVVGVTIKGEGDLVGSPGAGVDMEVRGEIGSVSLSRSSVDVVGPSSSVVKGGLVLGGVLSSSLIDVDLSGGSPHSVDRVSGHHPQSGPEVISSGLLGSDLKLSVLPGDLSLGIDSSRGVLLSVVCLRDRGDREFAVGDLKVVSVGGVALQFVVASSVAVDFVAPLGLVQAISVKFVLPHELVRLLCGGEADEGQKE